jgi:hypothetical protein
MRKMTDREHEERKLLLMLQEAEGAVENGENWLGLEEVKEALEE